MSEIYQTISDIVVVKYIYIVLLLTLLCMLIAYLKYWPKIIRVGLLNSDNYYLNLKTRKNIKFFINGKRHWPRVRSNPMRIRKWFGLGDRIEVSIMHPTKEKELIYHSEIKSYDRIIFIDFKFTGPEMEQINNFYLNMGDNPSSESS